VTGDDVGRRAALDHSHVGRRLVVDPPQGHGVDRGRCGDDRRPAVLGPDPGVRFGAFEVRLESLVGRSRGNHFADRTRVVEHEAKRRPQRTEVHLLGAAQPVLLGDREHQLEAHRSRRSHVPGAELGEDCDGGLVVGAEDRLAPAAEDPVGELHCDWLEVRDRVEVGEERDPFLPCPRDSGDQVSGAGARRERRVVLVHVDSELAQLGRDRVGNRALLAGRTPDLTEPCEAIEDAVVTVAHG
jgi:hypothetical protein